MTITTFKHLYRYAGLLTPLVALVSIVLVILTHPWFSFTNNDISDLGAIGVEYNYILNAGLILSGILATIFACGLLLEQKTTLGKVGSIMLFLGTICLILIGVFPKGTTLHFYVSVGFFLFCGTGMLVIGISEYCVRIEFTYFTTLLFSYSYALASICLNVFSGLAIPELVLITAMSVWIYARILWFK